MKKILIILIAILLTNNVFADEAMTAFSNKDYNEAYRIWSRTPDKPEALYGIGRILSEGLGSAPKNYDKGIGMISQASDGGYRPATNYLATVYEKNRNYQLAIKYYKKLSDGKNPEIEKKLAGFYAKLANGDPTSSEKYCESISKVFESQNKREDTVNQYDLAMCSLNGFSSGIPRDVAARTIEDEAYNLFQKKEHYNAMKLLKVLPVPSGRALYTMGVITYEGLGSIKKDTEKGKDFLKKSSQANYSDANKYLGKIYENQGELETAITYYAKYSNGKDAEIESHITQLLFDKAKGSSATSKETCEAILSSSKGANFRNKVQLNICAYENKITTPTKEQSFNALKEELAKLNSTNTEIILTTIGSELLNEKERNYEPELFEKGLWIADNNFKNEIIKGIVKKSEITFEKCRKQPAFDEPQKRRFISLCTLAAYNGDQNASLALAEIYSKKSEYGSINKDKSLLFLSKVNHDKDIQKQIIVRLNLTLSDRAWKKNIFEITEFVKAKKDYQLLTQYFEYQIEELNNFYKSAYDTESALILSDLLIEVNDLNLYKKSYIGLTKISKEKLNEFDDLNSAERKKLKINLELIKQKIPKSDWIKSEDSSQKQSLTVSNQKSEIQNQLQNDQSNTKRVGNDEATSTFSPENYAKYLSECNSEKSNSCYKAGAILLSNDAPFEYRQISAKDKKKIAKEIFTKGMGKKDIECMAAMYDLLNSELLNEQELRLKNSLLEDLISANSAAGFLRKYAVIVDPKNLLAGIGTALSILKIKDSCVGINNLIADGKLSPQDYVYGNEIIKGPICRIYI